MGILPRGFLRVENRGKWIGRGGRRNDDRLTTDSRGDLREFRRTDFVTLREGDGAEDGILELTGLPGQS